MKKPSRFSFAECRLFYRALFQKRPIILRSLLIVATQKRDGFYRMSTFIRIARKLAAEIQKKSHKAVCCSVCCSVLQCVAVCCSVLHAAPHTPSTQKFSTGCSGVTSSRLQNKISICSGNWEFSRDGEFLLKKLQQNSQKAAPVTEYGKMRREMTFQNFCRGGSGVCMGWLRSAGSIKL